MFKVTQLVGFGSEIFGDISVSIGTVGYDSANLTTYSLTTTNPNANVGRFLIGAAVYDAGSSTTTNISAITHNTVAQTRYVNATNILMPTGFFIVKDETNTSSTMTFTGSSGTNGFSSYFSVIGASSVTQSANAHTSNASANTLTRNVAIPSNGIVFAFAVSSSNTSPNAATWQGVDEVATAYVGADATYSLAYRKYPNGSASTGIRVDFAQTDRIALGVLVVNAS